MLGNKRIVITGLGLCTPLARNVHDNWNKLLNGETSIIKHTPKGFEDYKVQLSSRFPDYKPDLNKLNMTPKQVRRLCLNTSVALEAANEAIHDSGFLNLRNIGYDVGVMVGAGFGGISMIEENTIKYHNKGPNRVHSLIAPMTLPGTAAVEIARQKKFRRVAGSGGFACASGIEDLVEGVLRIRHDDCKVMVCGGTGEISNLTISGFGNAGALSTHDDPITAPGPFDKDRNGFVLGEGAGILVLEELNHALDRNAKIYGEIMGYYTTNDCFHQTASDPSGEWAEYAINKTLERARLNPDQINYINSHGTGTMNDSVESQVIKKVFQDNTKNIPVNSTKSMLGHTLNASGAIESIVSLLSLRDNTVHPTRNLFNPDVQGGCLLEDYVQGSAKEHKIDYVLNNAFAFGGRNTFMIFGRYSGK
jgi:3-oxoacyl-[acyl-carrier-protein] synthase II